MRIPRSRKAYARVETDAGEQAQVDWGHFGQMRVRTPTRPLSCFAIVLSWSRALYTDFSLSALTPSEAHPVIRVIVHA
ncbi:hypothetical protein BH09MYX1_BH09MYX1_55340 [soil metagenome]